MICSAEEFVQLRTSEVASDQARATHDSAPDEVWFDVLRRYPAMAFWVVHNKTVPLSVLRQVAEDPDRRARSAVARKRKLDYALFDLLSRDGDETVRAGVATNAKTPTAILERLARDESALVAEAARKSLRAGRRQGAGLPRGE